MANVDRPNGFSFGKSLTGHAPNAMLRFYPAADRSADTTNNHGDIYIGDAVKLSSGKAVVADSGDTILGVVVGVGSAEGMTFNDPSMYNANDLMKRYADLADTDAVVAVLPAEACLFEVQTSADLDLLQGSLADITTAAATAHGSRSTGRSSVELKAAVNNDVKVVEHVTTPDNDITLTNARHLVKFQTTENTL